ncbi:hypothetical protein [Rhizobium sp. CFBP 8762]|nr:hypothetical protein [Rhizobium sp. CFBP 8762]
MSHMLVVVGCGSMGFAMMRGWLQETPGLTVHVVGPTPEYAPLT